MIGTVFQLPSPDAIYSRDEERRVWVAILFCLGWRAAYMLLAAGVIGARKRLGQQPSHVT
jgi:hypothetical protein